MEYLNPEYGSYRRRHRRRNPQDVLDPNYWLNRGGFVNAAAVAAGFVFGDNIVDGTLKMGYSRTPAEKTADMGKVIIDAVAHVAVGVAGGALLDAAQQEALGKNFALGAFASGIAKLIANLQLLPSTSVAPGSLVISGGARTAAMPFASSFSPAGVRGNTAIGKLHRL